jgi:hypothetical protein
VLRGSAILQDTPADFLVDLATAVSMLQLSEIEAIHYQEGGTRIVASRGVIAYKLLEVGGISTIWIRIDFRVGSPTYGVSYWKSGSEHYSSIYSQPLPTDENYIVIDGKTFGEWLDGRGPTLTLFIMFLKGFSPA